MDNLEPPSRPSRPHSPAQAWTQRLPSPPRINVPPPLLDHHGLPALAIDEGSINFEANGFANAEFLRRVTHGNIVTHNAMIEWKYEQRHEAQQVLPFLFLGPVKAARDIEFLQKSQITMVLCVRNTLSAHARLLGSKTAESLGIPLKFVDVAGNQELIAVLSTTVDIINSHLSDMYRWKSQQDLGVTDQTCSSSPGKVLVFCESGNERSAAVVTAYIMAMYSFDLIKALQVVQSCRFAVSIDDTTRNYLETYSCILQAKRQVIQQQSNIYANHTGSVPNGKRTLEETYEDGDISMDEGVGNDDRESFETRAGLAPFQE